MEGDRKESIFFEKLKANNEGLVDLRGKYECHWLHAI